MFKVSTFIADTDTVKQMLSPMADCSVNDTLIKAAPLVNHSFFQMVKWQIWQLYTLSCKMPQIA